MPKLANAMLPSDFLARCASYGVIVEEANPKTGMVKLSKRFPAGSRDGYVDAETCVGIIYEIPQTESGSTWGTDGGSIGGAVGMQSGYMHLTRSGCAKRWLAKLAKARA